MDSKWQGRQCRECAPALVFSGVAVGLAFLLASATLAEGHPPEKKDVEAARRQADAATDKLVDTLMKQLTLALQEGGPEQAIRVCSDVAQDVTLDVGRSGNVIIRRTSLRNRNPANAPDAFERAWLERAEAGLAAGRKPGPSYVLRERNDQTMFLRHLRPIMYPGGLCNKCHGALEQIPAEVQNLLRERYPKDRATGFRAGQLRGAISVTVDLPQTPVE